ncbi:MAG TPA: LPS export ABC transporter permease LptF [Candidatus Dormibacteraeota bacterium]|nr:LPS export ABC transporter permease LptF [Candidatus Dormibacteraeota bacterium]
MRIIDRYIVRQVFSNALLGLAVFTFVFFVPQLVRLMELIVRHTGNASSVGLLFLTTVPAVLAFTIPMAVLVGVLIGLGRMSADSELIALNTVGISMRRILVPVGVLAVGGTAISLLITLWLGPLSLHTFRETEVQLLASQASFQLQPRVFDERFPRLVLYVHDVEAAGTHWHGVFLAESGLKTGSRLTLAEEAIVIPDATQGKLQFHLRGGSTHEYSLQDPGHYSVTTFGESDWPIEVSGLNPVDSRKPALAERSMHELRAAQGIPWREARVEFHRRLAFPLACVVFALIGVPLGARPRRGGRAIGFLMALILISAYYLLFIIGAGMAREGTVSPAVGIWGADALVGLLGLAMLPRIEQLHEENWISRLIDKLRIWQRRRRKKTAQAQQRAASYANGSPLEEGNGERRRGPTTQFGWRHSSGFPQLMDLYVLRNFVYYLLLFLVGFVFLFEAFTFFELLDDIAKHRSPFLVVTKYFWYLTPHLAYQIAPLAALVAVLVTLGVMTKNNEIVAFKATGVSLYRLSLPLLTAGLVLAGTMLFLDDVYLPYAFQRQDALRNQIKGRPARTYQSRRQWIFGENSKLFNYDVYDPDSKLFGHLNVFELDPGTFQMKRRVFATRAHWEETEKAWILESGWVRDFDGRQIRRYEPFKVIILSELTETPSYFTRELPQAYKMNWRELRGYISDLHQAGFDVASLTVQWHKKLAFPLIAPVIMLLAIPFAFLVGTRGAIGGVALGVGIGIVYWATSELFAAMGSVGQLPPMLAGWSPDFIYAFLGTYFFLKMPT